MTFLGSHQGGYSWQGQSTWDLAVTLRNLLFPFSTEGSCQLTLIRA